MCFQLLKTVVNHYGSFLDVIGRIVNEAQPESKPVRGTPQQYQIVEFQDLWYINIKYNNS